MKTVIMAGGKGTRIAAISQDIPKPMISVCGRPILEHQLDCLKRNGLTSIIMVVGHLGDVIKNHFGNGESFGCDISYYSETQPLGTAGALYKITGRLTDDFILVNGDIIFDIDFPRLIAFHHDKKALASLVVHPNSHPFDSALIISNADCCVTQWLNKEDPRVYYKNQVNSGIHILSKNIFSTAPAGEKVDLDRDILKPLATSGTVFAYNTPEYIKDAGTPERFNQVTSDIENGMVKQRNLSVSQRAVFLDRDGTINKYRGFITKPEDFELIPGAAEAVKNINRAGRLAIIITNQPVIARGDATLDELTAIHNKMETDLGKTGAFVDDIFFCPHHPDKGFPGERPEYKINCGCRKPKPGMLLAAAEKYNIDLSKSWMIGDENRDVEAGIAAGCNTILLKSGENILDAVTGILDTSQK